MAATDNTKVWYDANCHCRRVQLRLKCRPLYQDPSPSGSSAVPENTTDASSFTPLQVWDCNCSICVKNGYHNVYPDDPATEIQWISGEKEMTEYQYGPKTRGHFFCPTCGSSMMIRGEGAKMGKPDKDIVAGINVSVINALLRVTEGPAAASTPFLLLPSGGTLPPSGLTSLL